MAAHPKIDPAAAIVEKTYDPEFSSKDADVVLTSKEGVLFRVHSYTLRTTSGFFSDMFRLPQCASEGEVIPTNEDASTLSQFLCIISGLPIPAWPSYAAMSPVLTLADNWDAPGVLSTLRAACTSQALRTTDPLGLYALSTHFGWGPEAQLASRETLTLDLHSPEHAASLTRMAAKDLMPLLQLHRARRDAFRAILDCPVRFAAGNTHCGVTPLDNHPWRALKDAMVLEIERRPLGDTLTSPLGPMAEWDVAKECWSARCSKRGCGWLNYDRLATMKEIRACLQALPDRIEID
ncbi:hypothetical protein BD779DRAFT_1614192 [Infundibulicybe gibba]|nr:hypothetical protein BD779DRAFT_1614192 [Infundibulicybe gibba]